MPAHGSDGSSSSGAMGARKPDDVKERNRTDKQRKADVAHPEDPERTVGKWMRAGGSKRNAGDEDEESNLMKA